MFCSGRILRWAVNGEVEFESDRLLSLLPLGTYCLRSHPEARACVAIHQLANASLSPSLVYHARTGQALECRPGVEALPES